MNARTPRRDLDRPVGLLYQGLYQVCHGLEISEGGIGLAADLVMAVNDEALLTIVLPGPAILIARVSVRYLSPKRHGKLPIYGLVFQLLPVPERRVVRSYISAKSAHAS